MLSILDVGVLHGSQEGVWLRTVKLCLGVGSVVSHRSYRLRECSRNMNAGTVTVPYQPAWSVAIESCGELVNTDVEVLVCLFRARRNLCCTGNCPELVTGKPWPTSPSALTG